MTDTDTLRDTIIPKSDQLNYDDLLMGPIDVTITGVRRGTKEQPVIIEIEGHEPYKPCKNMRRVLIAGWGEKGSAWVGRRMTLFGEPTVKYGGVEVGGIRISRLSNITGDLNVKLTISRGKRVEFVVHPLPPFVSNHHPLTMKQRVTNCRAFLDEQGLSVAKAEAHIEKPLDKANAADLKRIAEWAKETATPTPAPEQPEEQLPFEDK